MHLLLTYSHEEFADYTRPWADYIAPPLALMEKEIESKTALGLQPAFRSCANDAKRCMRRLEYSFVLRVLETYLKLGRLEPDHQCSVLDVGCGGSPLPIALANGFGVSVRGVDIAPPPGMQGFAKRVAGGRVSYHRCDLRRMSFRDEAFDVVTCVSVLEHVPRGEDSKGVCEMLRVLRPSGVLIVTVDYRADRPVDVFLRAARRAWKGFHLLANTGIHGTMAVARSPKPYTRKTLLTHVINSSAVGAVRGRDGLALRDLSELRTSDIRSFWKRHWEPDTGYPRAGRDYASVGLVFAKDPSILRGLSCARFDPGNHSRDHFLARGRFVEAR